MTIFGQVVIGPPGSGKTTYCLGMCDFLRQIGRPCYVINFDPANESLDDIYADVEGDTSNANVNAQNGLKDVVLFDVMEEVISLNTVMEKFNLGPNGGLIYCMEYIAKHIELVVEKMCEAIETKQTKDEPPPYLLFDFPGQVELYTHNTSVQMLIEKLVSKLDYRLSMIHLIDAHNCLDPTKFISAVLLATTTMLRIGLPCVNVLSKVDLLGGFGGMRFNLDFFTEVMDLSALMQFLDAPIDSTSEDSNIDISDDTGYMNARRDIKNSTFYKKHKKLHEALVELIDDFGLVKFVPLNVSDATSVGRVVAQVDKCNGYVFDVAREWDEDEEEYAEKGGNVSNLFRCAVQAEGFGKDYISDVQEKFLGGMFEDEIQELGVEKNRVVVKGGDGDGGGDVE